MTSERHAFRRTPALVALAAAGILGVYMNSADAEESVDQFYRAHSITLLIPSGTGGGYDTYGRLLSRHIGTHIPGKPTVIPQNMPGAGGLVQANYLYNVAPKDGSVIGLLQNGIPLRPLFDEKTIKYKIEGFDWLGSVTNVTNTAVVRSDSKIRFPDDVLTKEIVVGASGGTALYLPEALNSVVRTKFKIVKGYKSTSNILLAIDSGEVDGLVGIAWDSLKAAKGDNVEGLRILFQMGLTPNPKLANAPSIMTLPMSDEERATLQIIFAGFEIGRSFVVAKIPQQRLKTLRAAFADTMNDPAFLADAAKIRVDVNPKTPEDIQEIIRRVYAAPRASIERAKVFMENAD